MRKYILAAFITAVILTFGGANFETSQASTTNCKAQPVLKLDRVEFMADQGTQYARTSVPIFIVCKGQIASNPIGVHHSEWYPVPKGKNP